MKKNYYDEAILFDNLYNALRKCCRNVRWKDSVARYEGNILLHTYRLRQQLLSNQYELSPYQIFKIYEPKEREVAATRIKDRQFQMALCDNGFYEDITESFINDNPACQRNAGLQKAHDRITANLVKYYRKYGHDGWFIKGDIHHFFPETDHEVAYQAILQRTSDIKAARQVKKIIDSFGDGIKGIGLGSQISQLIELAVLDGLDHFIKEQLHIKYYVRYMDDFILLHPDKQYLQQCWRAIECYLTELKFALNPKTTLQPVRYGIYMLQWHFIITDTGRIVSTPHKKKIKDERHKMRALWQKEVKGEVPPNTTKIHLRAWLGDKSKGDAYNICSDMIKYYRNLTHDSFSMKIPIMYQVFDWEEI